MKSLIFVSLILAITCQVPEMHYFRYKEGSLKVGDDFTFEIFGSFFHIEQGGEMMMQFAGTERTTMTPFMIVGSTEGAGLSFEYKCLGVMMLGEENKKLTGTIKFEGTWDKAIVSGDCVSEAGEHWIFKSEGVKSDSMFYPPVEAGLRAKYLVGRSSDICEAPAVIMYAIADMPFTDIPCQFFTTFDDLPGPEPGAVIVGDDAEHCAIVDNEGDKFIHSNPIKDKVTYESLALVHQYFPNGFTYKAYPVGLGYKLANLIH